MDQLHRTFQKYQSNLGIAITSLMGNKLRSVLTALGVIFGVGAVIAMLAIGSGARQEVLEQMEMVGLNNIIIEGRYDVDEDRENGNNGGNERKKYSPGLTLADAESLREIIPSITRVSPEVHFNLRVMYDGRSQDSRLIGASPDFFDINNLTFMRGSAFTHKQGEESKPVCVIGHRLQGRLFSGKDPVGERIKIGQNWFTVVGVLAPRYVSESLEADMGVMDFGMDVIAPIESVLLRHRDRGNIMQAALRGRDDDRSPNYHQLDRLVIQAEETEKLEGASSVAKRTLTRRHNDVEDFTISIPELLLRQEQRTRDIFNLVLGAIAGISLLVGGIGIMNIMLASVWERIREIGLRKAVGATNNDIIAQFVFEAILISIGGGLIGIALGTGLAYAISYFADIQTLVTLASVIIAFVVSALVGLVFGIMPARKAALQDPITSLRHE